MALFTSPRVTSTIGILGFGALLYALYVVTTPGEFAEWTDWSKCSVSCGNGEITRSRTCTDPAPGMFGLDCNGPRIERRACQEKPCPVNGGYSEWSPFGQCDKSCGGGQKKRTRLCSNPFPQNGGRTCQALGVPEESQACNVQPCPVNGGYSDWGAYSGCEIQDGKGCGKGKKVRARTCNKPVPQHGGKPCEGPDKETAECEIPCSTTQPPNTNTTSKTPTNASTIPTKPA